MLTLDPRGFILHAHYDYWQSIGLFEFGELEGKLIEEVLPGIEPNQPGNLLDQAWENGEARFPGIQVRSRTLDAFAKVVIANTGKLPSQHWCQLLLWDRTDQVAEQTSMESAQQKLAEFTADLPAMLYQTHGNAEGTHMSLPYLSDYTQMLTGYSPNYLQENPNMILAAIHAEDRRAYYESALESMEKVSTFEIDMRIVSTDDSSRWVRCISQPRRFPDKSIRFTGVAVVIDDLIEEIESLKKSRDSMGQFTHERLQSLMQTKHDLEQEVLRREQAHEEFVQQQHMLRRMLELQDQQRKLLSYDLHDGFVQEVIGAKMIVEGAAAASEPNRDDLELACTSLANAIEEVRRMIAELRPLAIESEGLLEAIETLRASTRSAGIEVKLQHNLNEFPLPPRLESHVYRMIQEGLSNVRKHADTSQATLLLACNNQDLQIEIIDYGTGFQPEEVSQLRFGLEGMRQRARMLGGSFQINSEPGQGTKVTIRLPVE